MALVEVVCDYLEVPAVEAVAASVGHDVAGGETLIWLVADEVAVPAAVDTHNHFCHAHERTVPRSGPDCTDDYCRDDHSQDLEVRVVSGSAGGRKLEVPDGSTTRPTTDRVREAVFNSLYSLDAIEGARVVDLFAGSGALGIEALSRGAASAVFVESDRRVRQVIDRNLESLDFVDLSTVVNADGPSYLDRAVAYDLLLLDPPYGFEEWDQLLARVGESVVVIESDREIEVPDHWLVHRARRYSATVVTLATATAQPGG